MQVNQLCSTATIPHSQVSHTSTRLSSRPITGSMANQCLYVHNDQLLEAAPWGHQDSCTPVTPPFTQGIHTPSNRQLHPLLNKPQAHRGHLNTDTPGQQTTHAWAGTMPLKTVSHMATARGSHSGESATIFHNTRVDPIPTSLSCFKLCTSASYTRVGPSHTRARGLTPTSRQSSPHTPSTFCARLHPGAAKARAGAGVARPDPNHLGGGESGLQDSGAPHQ